ncbi:MAG TPA: hypothetical protein VKB23_11645 [Solirubrobacterales bacterium]|nr:hypothetical protein [Solirubrobacterales bacterium]
MDQLAGKNVGGARRLATCANLVACVGLLVGGAGQAVAGRSVLVANCGSLGYLSFEPTYWSAGCTAGSPTIEEIDWVEYGGRKAYGTGTAPVQDCGCADPSASASYPARVVLTKPRRCRTGRRARYFSKARLTVTYPEGNPFGEQPGDLSSSWHVPGGRCEYAPLRPAARPASAEASAAGPRYFMSCGYPPVYSYGDYYDGRIRYRSQPRSCDWSEDGSTAALFVLEKIHWRGWGTDRAHARALRVDNHDMDNNGFQRHRIRFTLFAPRPAVGHSGKRRLYYTKMRVSENGHSGVENLFRPGQPAVVLPEYRAASRPAPARRGSGTFFVPTGRRSGFGAFRESAHPVAALRHAFGPPGSSEYTEYRSCVQRWPEIGVVVSLVAFGSETDACGDGTFVEARLTDPRWHTATGVHPGGSRASARRAAVRRCRPRTIGCAATGYALELHRTDCASTLSPGVIAHTRGHRVASLNVYWRSCE